MVRAWKKKTPVEDYGEKRMLALGRSEGRILRVGLYTAQLMHPYHFSQKGEHP